MNFVTQGAPLTRLLVFYLLVFFSSTTVVYSQHAEKQSIIAALTLNLARFTRWPIADSESNGTSINLCVVGDNIVQVSFENYDNTLVNNRMINIINISRLRNLSQCQILYIDGLEHHVLTQVLFELKGQPILTIGENIEFIKMGGMVALTKESGKIQLNINLPIIKNSKLVISSRILKLATLFDYPYPMN